MNIERAKQIALAAWPANMAAKFFFITNDEKCFINPNDAVINAVKLSAGNPEVTTVNVEELELPEGFEAPVINNETITNTRLSAMNALEIKINELAAEIIKLDNADEINDENMSTKMHVAGLKQQLKDAANSYTEFDPTGIGPFDATVINLVGQLFQPEQIAPAPEDTITVTPPADETVTPPADETVTPPADETVTPPADETVTPPADETVTPPADEKKNDDKAEGVTKAKRNTGKNAITE